MGRFNSSLGLLGLAALYVYLGGLSGACARPYIVRSPGANATTAVDRPVPVGMVLHKRVDAAWYFGGVSVIGTVAAVACKDPELGVVAKGAFCIVTLAALVIAGITAAIVGLITKDLDSFGWVVSHPATHSADGQWRWIGALDKGGSAKGHVYHMYDEQAGLRGIRASIDFGANDSTTKRGDEPRQSGDTNGLHLDYVWKDDDQSIERKLGHHHNLEHELDRAFVDAINNRNDIAGHQGYFCADIVAAGSTVAATQGAFFVFQGLSYPYQPGQSSAVVSDCHYRR